MESIEDKEQKRRERKERAVKEREETIRAERQRVEENINKSRAHLYKGEDEVRFRCAADCDSYVLVLV